MKHAWLSASLALLVVAAAASPTSPYVDQVSREIKALSETEIAGLLEGKGMGYARAAELNGYPGPAHVMAHADELRLSAEQRAQSRAIFERMSRLARAAGAELVAAERELDRAFREKQITPQSLARSLEEIGRIEARLRNIHLLAHLEQTRILAPEQVDGYRALRGYH